MAVFIATFEDVLDRLDFFLRGRIAKAAGSVNQQIMRGAVESALREIVSVRDWQSFRRYHRVALNGAQATGSVAYDAATYTVTLTGATWPSWAAYGEILLDGLVCQIDSVTNDTTLVLKSPLVPLDDLAAGTAYTLGRSWYPLPDDFHGAWTPGEKGAWFIGINRPLEELTQLTKYRTATGTVSRWSIGPTPDRYNSLSLYVYPWASADSAEDFWMKVKPRDVQISGKESWNHAGTVTVAEGGTTVTGSGTSFRSLMEGAIIRFSSTSTKPTAANGSNPYIFQQSVTSVASTTSLTIGGAAPTALSGVGYVVSDPIDLMGHVYDAFLRCCEKNLAYSSGFEDQQAIGRMYQVTLTQAKMADSPVKQATVAGVGRRYYTRLSDTLNRASLQE